MSVTGFWIVGAVQDSEVARIRKDFPRLPAVGCLMPNFPAELGWWKEESGSEGFFNQAGQHGPEPTASALRFRDFIDNSRIDSDLVEEMKERVMELFPQCEGKDLFCASARKGDPMAALSYALGPTATLQLPGWFGDFLLSSEQVLAVLPNVESALTLSPDQRVVAVSRVRDWMTAMGDDPDHDADELLDGPLRVLRSAARTGRAVAGQTRWY